jgi:hypothetical protein
MTDPGNAFLSLPTYWDGITEALSARLTASKKYLRHPVAGFSAEGYYIDLLREYLPKRYAVESGFVINAAGDRSQHLDIIVADTFHIPPLCSEPTYRVFAAESVCAVIEVTTSPRGREKGIGKLEQDIGKLAQVRTLCKDREYFEIQPVVVGKKIEYRPVSFMLTGSPRCYIVTSGDEWKSSDTYKKNVVASLNRLSGSGNEPWLNAAFSLQHGLLEFRAYTKFQGQWITTNALLQFLLTLNQAIATFSTFKVDLKRYAKSLSGS